MKTLPNSKNIHSVAGKHGMKQLCKYIRASLNYLSSYLNCILDRNDFFFRGSNCLVEFVLINLSRWIDVCFLSYSFVAITLTYVFLPMFLLNIYR